MIKKKVPEGPRVPSEVTIARTSGQRYVLFSKDYTESVISRRSLLAVPLLAACGRRRGGTGFRGYAFVANEEGQAIAAVDLEALAVARHIPLAGSPTSVLAGVKRPFVYALTAANGTVHELEVDRLRFTRKLAVASSAVAMQMASD